MLTGGHKAVLLRPGVLLRIGVILTLVALAFIGVNTGIQALYRPGPGLPYAAVYVLATLLLSGGAAIVFRNRPKLFMTLFALVAFGAALAVALWANTEPIAEYARMLQTALDLRAGQWDALRSNEYYHAWAYQSGFVLYQALVLTLLPPSITSLLVVNALVMTGIKVMLYVLLRRNAQPETAIFLAMLYLMNPASYLLASVLTNQHISLFLLLLGLCVLGRNTASWAGAAASGLCFALACATRPDAQLIYPVLVLLSLLLILQRDPPKPRSKAKNAHAKTAFLRTAQFGMLLSVAVGVAAGWLLSGLVSVTGLNPGGLRNYDPLWKLAFGLNIKTEGRFDMALAETLLAAETQAERAQMESEIVQANLSQGAGAMAAFLLDKINRSWRDVEPASWAFAGQGERIVPLLRQPLKWVLPVLQLAERLLTLCLVILVCWSFVRCFRQGADASAALCALVILGFFLIHAVIEFQPRYRYLVWPFVTMAASGGADVLFRMIRRTVPARSEARKYAVGKRKANT